MRKPLAAIILSMVSVLCVVAGETDTVSLRLAEVEVLGTMYEGETYDVRRIQARYTKEDIAALPATTVADVLQMLPGLDIRTRGANGAQADISMHGGTFDQVTVLLNGFRINDAQTGHYTLNLPIPLAAIERIEVLQDAINIITRKPEADAYQVDLQLGMNRLGRAELFGGWRRQDWRVIASAEYSHANGYYAPKPSEKEQTAITNSDYDIANVYGNASWQGLELQVGAQFKNAGAGSFYGFGSQDQFDATRTAFGSARYAHSWGNWSVDAQAAYRANYDRYEWHRGTISNKHFTQNAAAAVRAHYQSSIGRTTLGVEARDEHIRSTNFGTHNRLHIEYFARQTFHVQGFSASLAASGLYNTSFGHHWTAGADVGYTFPFGLTLYANANRSLRMPTFTDLYYNAGNQLGDKNLRPEKMWTVSVGGAYRQQFDRAGSLALSADVYHRWGRDIIDWVYVAEDTKRPYHAANQQKVNTLGVEFSASYRWNEWLRQIQVTYAYTLLDIDLVEANSRYLDYLRHKLVLHLEHGIYKGLGASWTFSYRARQGQFNDAQGVVQNYEPVCLLDGQLFYDYKHWRVAVECTNMTNRHYYDYGGILQPGAWCKLHLTYKL